MIYTRQEVINRLKEEVSEGKIIIGVSTGTGIAAMNVEAGGVDLIAVYNSAKYRMADNNSLAGLLPYGDANQIVVDMGNEVLPAVKNTPVLAGVCGTDPFRVMEIYLKQLKEQGFSGVQNFPTVGLFDSVFRDNLEDADMGYSLEVEMIRKAHKLDLFTCPYVFNKDDAKNMAIAGADCLVLHMGLITHGPIGTKTALTLDDCALMIQEICDTGKSINPDIIVMCHGGPVLELEHVQYVMAKTHGLQGFFEPSCIERSEVEKGIRKQVAAFKKIITLGSGEIPQNKRKR